MQRLQRKESSLSRATIRTIFAVIFTIAASLPLDAATFTVTNTNNDGAGSLRQAILDANAAAGADVITFNAAVTGTITLTTGELTVTDGVTITGPGADVLSVSGNNSSSVFHISGGATAAIDSLTVTGGNGGGILVDGSILNLNNSAVSNNSANAGGGIYCSEGELHLTNSTVSGNSAVAGGGGIWMTRDLIGGVLTLTNSTVSGNTATAGSGGGILLYLSSATLTNSTLSNNSGNPLSGGGIFNQGLVTIINSIVANSTGGDIVNLGGTTNADHSLIEDGLGVNGTNTNNLTGDPLLGLLANNGGPTQTHALLPGSPAINTGTNTGAPATDQRGILRPQLTTTDIGAFEFVCEVFTNNRAYVNALATGANNGTTWADAFTSLQSALGVTGTCGVTEIWVAAGTYKPTAGTDRTISFVMKNSVAIYGGFPNTGNPVLADRNWGTNPTILSGDIGTPNDSTDNSYHVIFNDYTSGSPLTSTAVLDGFTITGGHANAVAPHSNGGGMYNMYASPTVSNCTFTRNTVVRSNATSTESAGGGMYNANSSPGVSNCTFSDNKARANNTSGHSYGAGMYNSAGSPTVTNCTFSNNSTPNDDEDTFGGGLCNVNTTVIVSGCTFTSNQAVFGGGMYNDGSSITVSNCTFSNNSILTYPGGVNGGAMNNKNTAGTVSGCIFLNNSGVGAVGVEVYSGTPVIAFTRSVFSGNNYGIANQSAAPTVTNCLFVGNTYGGIVNWTGSSSAPTITNSTFSENPGSGLGSISNYATSSPTLTNCILYGSGNSVYVSGGGVPPTITYSNVKQTSGVFTGTGNINQDPMYTNSADPDGADNTWMTSDDGLALQGGSPSINAGTNDGAPGIDITGVSRPLTVSDRSDMGAYEAPYTPSVTSLNAIQSANTPTEGTFAGLAGALSNATIGWSFTVGATSISVSHLGLYDAGSNGLANAHDIGIWTSGGSLVTSSNIPSGTTAILESLYRYVAITPVTLNAGQTYVVGALYPTQSGDNIIYNSTQSYASGIAYDQSRQTTLNVTGTDPLTFPNVNGSHAQGIFGPNFQFSEVTVVSHTFIVTNTNDAGAGSLRVAMENANTLANINAATPDTIAFNIAGVGPHTIAPLTALPTITDPVFINGYTQPGASPGTLKIVISGASAPTRPGGGEKEQTQESRRAEILASSKKGKEPITNSPLSGTDGLTITAGNTTVQGLVINSFSGSGILIQTLGYNTIRGNFIGTDVTGTVDVGNSFNGIDIENSPSNIIGGTTSDDRNIISGNNNSGIYIVSTGSIHTKVLGNYIGTDVGGTLPLGNSVAGVNIFDVLQMVVGDTTVNSRNVIAFNGGPGVVIGYVSSHAIPILTNSIFGNSGIGIDLGQDSITPNDAGDADYGPNNFQNFPEMTLAQRQGNGDLSVTYKVTSTVANSTYPLRIEFFKAQGGQGKTFLGAQSYASASAELPVTQTFTPNVAMSVGDTVVATATDSLGNTSEFSAVSFVAPSDPSGIISDDFNSPTLKPFWQFINPGNPSTLSLVGTGTIDARLRIQIPDGASHDVWSPANRAPRIMQNCNNIDFEVEVKFDQPLTSQYQLQGIIVEQDANRYLRFDFVKDNVNTRLFVASFTGGTPTVVRDLVIPPGSPSWMRLKREGDMWTQSYSYDGVNFTSRPAFSNVLNVTKIGPFVGNAGYPEGTAPAFDGLIDYFFSTATPIVPEDGTVSGPSITQHPANKTVQVGQTAQFTVGATGTVPLSYQWQKNNVNIGGATGTNYTTPPTALADNGSTFRCIVSNSIGTVTSNSAVLTVASPAPGSSIVSDDFNSASINTSLWTIVNPGTPSTLGTVGTGTADARLSIAVPAGSSHDVWSPSNNAPRIMQPMGNTDFEVEVKFEQPMTAGYQLEGVIVQQDAQNYLRFGFVRDFTNTRLFAASFVGGNPTTRQDINITGNIGARPSGGDGVEEQGSLNPYSAVQMPDKGGSEYPPYIGQSEPKGGGDPSLSDAPSATLYLRVKRLGNSWTQSYSTNGATFIAGGSFSHTLTPSSIGPYIGNAGFPASASPAFTGLIDYFFNTGAPIVPEDGTTSPPVITTQPVNQAVSEGQSATFSVGATGSATLVFQWQKNTVNIPSANDPSYNTPTTTLGDDGSTFRCIVSNSTGTVTSNPATLTVTSATNPSGIFSDDFHANTLDPRWIFTNPAPTSVLSLVGSGTANARLSVAVPAGSNHDVWSPANAAPRIMQPANNTDFELEAKFEQSMTAGYQIEGIIVEESPGNYIRFGFVRDPGTTRIFAASFVGNAATVRTDFGITQSNPLYVRVKRTGNTWLQSYSNNGSTYTDAGPFNHTLAVTKVGPYIGNAGFPSNTSPAFTGLVDYFFNRDFPIVPEDGALPKAGDAIVNIIPDHFVLKPNYPNPFNPTTTISYGLPEPAHISLKVYNTLGQEVAALAEGERPAGTFNVVWDGRNRDGNTVGSGVYLYRIVAINAEGKAVSALGKMILMK